METATTQNPFFAFVKRYSDRVRDLVTRPNAFYRTLKPSDDFWDPTLFALVNLLIPKLIFAIILIPLTFGLTLVGVIPSVLSGVLFIALMAFLLYGIVRCLGNEDSILTAYQVVAYASIANYISLVPIPIISSLLFSIAFSVLIYIGLKETYGFPTQKAVWIAVVPGVLSLIASLASMLFTLIVILFWGVQLVMWFFVGEQASDSGSMVLNHLFVLFSG